MTARVLFLGFDALEVDLVDRWTATGALPGFAALGREAAMVTMTNRLDALPGAIWPEITSGISSGNRPLYYFPRQLKTGEDTPRAVREDEVDTDHLYWSVASRAGRRVAVVDHSHVARVRPLNGVQLLEWGSHDRVFATVSEPPALRAELEARVGAHPVVDCDAHDDSLASFRTLLDQLRTGVERKTELLLDLLAREQWDLFTASFGESHCVGHQFWHFLDPGSPWYSPTAPADLQRAIPDIYAALDTALVRLREAAGPNARVFVLASHGMGPIVGGPQLLDDVLPRLGTVKGGAGLRGRIPRPVRAVLKRVIPERRRAATRYSGLASPGTVAVPVINNRCGAVRLNLVGREPHGAVQPGADADAVLADITAALFELRQPSSGEPIVARVTRATDAFGPDHHPDVPDLLVTFRRDLGVLDECESARVGRVKVAANGPWMPRTGDHTEHSRLWVTGPGVRTGLELHGDVLDVAPTVLDALGVAVPDRYDGRVLDLTPAATD